MRKFALVIMTILLMISIAACGIGSDLPDTEEGSLTENSMQNAERTETESDGGAYIILNMNGTDIHARLYDNTAAEAFLDLLPYTVTVSRATDDLCGSV
ncbi:MAG: hypothetical protein J1E64_15470, partial [Acetatifactor sp.]|nr:hypothetical protein [Acetatifactor sp.]